MLQGKYKILERGSCLWYKNSMSMIMKCCVIRCNIMVEERDNDNTGVIHDGHFKTVRDGITS